MSSFHIVYHGPAIWVHSDYVRRTADDHTGARDLDAEVVLAVNEHLASLFLRVLPRVVGPEVAVCSMCQRAESKSLGILA